MSEMSWLHFKTRVPGKWVLAGEHAVLRGATAVALPHPESGLSLEFVPSSAEGDLKIEPADAAPVIRELLGAVQDERTPRPWAPPQGTLTIQSSIPVGAGLGSSAALCVAMTRWLAEPLAIAPADQHEFARRLEHRFHGKSSGMDVAAALSGAPIAFSMEQGARALGVRKLPRFSFHDTGLRTRTSDCVLQVERFREENPAQARQVDESMSLAARQAMEALIQYDQAESPENRREALEILAQAVTRAQECFYAWRLVPGQAARIEQDLKARGALATKLTGAGGGGFVIALWPPIDPDLE